MTTYFHSFIVLESTEGKPITKLSPFAIKWYLSANVAPKSVKTVCNNTVEVTKKKYAELLLLKMNTLYNMKIKTCPHWSLNTSRGVVRNPELSACRSEEIKKTSIGYRENNNKKNDQLIDTNTYILTFDTPKLPPKLKIGYTIVKVDIYIYIPNLLWCYNCQKFGPMKAGAQKRQYAKNLARMVLTTQNLQQTIKMCKLQWRLLCWLKSLWSMGKKRDNEN